MILIVCFNPHLPAAIFFYATFYENDGQKHIANDLATGVSQDCGEPYRLKSSDGHYALFNRGGKQFRRTPGGVASPVF
jgi:hypothetical protein